mmetsp:Transcript_15722/g.30927  ORF Transcript_15722/g.30927 Transcript_15722/m.30927 type:complete len:271 (-) Transcript_15722:304-1116(-)
MYFAGHMMKTRKNMKSWYKNAFTYIPSRVQHLGQQLPFSVSPSSSSSASCVCSRHSLSTSLATCRHMQARKPNAKPPQAAHKPDASRKSSRCPSAKLSKRKHFVLRISLQDCIMCCLVRCMYRLYTSSAPTRAMLKLKRARTSNSQMSTLPQFSQMLPPPATNCIGTSWVFIFAVSPSRCFVWVLAFTLSKSCLVSMWSKHCSGVSMQSTGKPYSSLHSPRRKDFNFLASGRFSRTSTGSVLFTHFLRSASCFSSNVPLPNAFLNMFVTS